MSHDRIDVAVNPIEHVAHLGVALPEIPCGRNERDSQDEESD